MMNVPSQITAASLSTLVVLFIAMANELEWITITEDQYLAVNAFIVALANLGFGTLLWWVNRGNPNPTAPAKE